MAERFRQESRRPASSWSRFGPSAERSRLLLDQLELQLEELEATAIKDEAAAEPASKTGSQVKSFARRFAERPLRVPEDPMYLC